MNEMEKKLTLDRPATYHFKVPGVLDARWSEWDEGMKVKADRDGDGLSITNLTGAVD